MIYLYNIRDDNKISNISGTSVHHSTSPVNETLLVFAAERRAAAPWCCSAAAGRTPLSIDISCRHGAQQQTRRTPRLRSHDGTDEQTDGRSIVS